MPVACRWHPRRSIPIGCAIWSGVSGGGSASPVTTSTRSTARRSPDRHWSTARRRRRPWTSRSEEHKLWAGVDLDERRTPGVRRGRRPDRTPRPAGAAARLGDRQTLASRLRRCRPLHGRGPVVPRADRAPTDHERREAAPTASGPGVQHRQLELPDERAGAFRTGASPGRQRGDRQDPEPRGLPHLDAGPRPHAARRPPGHAALGNGLAPGRHPHPVRRDRRAGLRRRSGQRAAGRRLAWPTRDDGTCSSRKA